MVDPYTQRQIDAQVAADKKVQDEAAARTRHKIGLAVTGAVAVPVIGGGIYALNEMAKTQDRVVQIKSLEKEQRREFKNTLNGLATDMEAIIQTLNHDPDRQAVWKKALAATHAATMQIGDGSHGIRDPQDLKNKLQVAYSTLPGMKQRLADGLEEADQDIKKANRHYTNTGKNHDRIQQLEKDRAALKTRTDEQLKLIAHAGTSISKTMETLAIMEQGTASLPR